jgi:hypothetical protein
LANDSLYGRAAGSAEELKTLAYIEQSIAQFTELKMQRQAFDIKSATYETLTANNGFYFLDNNSATTLLLSAHYDHIGLGGDLSTAFIAEQIHNGADDNASGVALTTSLFQAIIERKLKDINYVVAFYSGHELGLYGSSAFAEAFQDQKKMDHTISAVINFDMVGRFDPELKSIRIYSNKAADSYFKNFTEIDPNLLVLKGSEKKLELLDTKAFHAQNLPCLSVTTGVHLDYHKPSDDAQYINYEGIVTIRDYILQLIDDLSD